ncbi:hypothetical protein ABZ297_43510 [Nonomuraea sp. NPDC005983]|uniref:hypothetical protein n=1 Tax=Nonomuraea sp. NPDC005983 TaxID=3155595 RepID=UPI0033AE8BC6
MTVVTRSADAAISPNRSAPAVTGRAQAGQLGDGFRGGLEITAPELKSGDGRQIEADMPAPRPELIPG